MYKASVPNPPQASQDTSFIRTLPCSRHLAEVQGGRVQAQHARLHDLGAAGGRVASHQLLHHLGSQAGQPTRRHVRHQGLQESMAWGRKRGLAQLASSGRPLVLCTWRRQKSVRHCA